MSNTVHAETLIALRETYENMIRLATAESKLPPQEALNRIVRLQRYVDALAAGISALKESK